ncbi:MAG: TatD family hydrolase [Lachnospiraceae bacterium]|nr:TatD family hydrolase [Lachnospiraceae bacterium]
MRIFDTHAHYDDRAFNEDREELIASLKEKGVEAVTNIAVTINSSKVAVEYTKKYDFFYGTVGVHPSDAYKEKLEDIDVLRKLALANEKIVAIGEIGLDYHYDDTDKPMQKTWFEAQMDLARELKLPIVVHSRDAAKDTLDIMRASKAVDIGGVVHCYSYSKEQARDYLNMGYYFGIGGVLTFKNAKAIKEVVDYVPLDHIVLETDSPYLSPDPFRSKRNDSSRLPYVAAAIADIKQVPVEQVYEETWNNAHKLYRIKQ